ncbi:inactive protein RESTRICTED TEV MOVEMENT 2 [Alnus glutinosa]|uniref:inactive protein RESTRICTED TEV MOVEMENT 2 n=1 Tax=Alnus glutinosa TaxID=3517 RepID=UPI002D770AA8|nr:inactive protein RESTRICTED TEV MOVEMENT 2 [Alnus glutinosa]
METNASANPEPSRFEPFCRWRAEEGRDILEVHLPGFKREQLRVRINIRGGLIIFGDCTNPLSSFHKQVEIPKDCNADAIRAKFVSEILYITMPKKFPRSSAGKPKQENSQSKVEEDSRVKESSAGEKTKTSSARLKYWFESAVSRLGISRRMAIAVVVLMIVVATYVTLKCRKVWPCPNYYTPK